MIITVFVSNGFQRHRPPYFKTRPRREMGRGLSRWTCSTHVVHKAQWSVHLNEGGGDNTAPGSGLPAWAKFRTNEKSRLKQKDGRHWRKGTQGCLLMVCWLLYVHTRRGILTYKHVPTHVEQNPHLMWGFPWPHILTVISKHPMLLQLIPLFLPKSLTVTPILDSLVT